MDPRTYELLSARVVNPFDTGMPQAAQTYELLGANLTNPFNANEPQPAQAQEPSTGEFLDPVYPRGWTANQPPVAIRIPAEYNPNDPAHASAVSSAYASAYEELPKATVDYLAESEGQQARVNAQKQAASAAREQLAAAEKALKYKFISDEYGGKIPVPNTNWTAKEWAEREIKINDAKKALKTAEAGLAEAQKPIQPKIFEVSLPKAAPEPPAQETQAAPTQAPAQAPVQPQEVAGEEPLQESRQQRIYRLNIENANKWARRQLERGVKHEEVKAYLSSFMDELKAKMKPEYRKLGDGLYYFKDPSSDGVKVSDTAQLRKEIYTENLTAFSKQMQNLNEIDYMAGLAEEAASLKPGDQRRAAIITALGAATKAINTAIAGTSDAVSQQEYNRVAGALGMGIINNWTQAFNQDSISKLFTTNPKGFAEFARNIRDIAANRTKGNYDTVKALEERVGVKMQEVPDWYKSAISKGTSESKLIQKNPQAAPQPSQSIVTKSGTQVQINKK